MSFGEISVLYLMGEYLIISNQMWLNVCALWFGNEDTHLWVIICVHAIYTKKTLKNVGVVVDVVGSLKKHNLMPQIS